MRQYNRRIFDLNKEKVYKLAKLDALLQRCNIRISNYLSSTDSRSYKEVMRLLSEGETSPGRLMEARMANSQNLNLMPKFKPWLPKGIQSRPV